MKHPAYPEMFKQRQERMKRGVLACVAPILVSECKLVLHAWYGGYFRAGCALIAMFISEGCERCWTRLQWRFMERMGWIKWRRIFPGEAEPQKAHGAHCDYHNCNDSGCIDKAIPKWFKILTRWKDYDEI